MVASEELEYSWGGAAVDGELSFFIVCLEEQHDLLSRVHDLLR